MAGSFFPLNIAATALQASQVMLDVAAANIANDQTPGYTEETAQLTNTPPYGVPTLESAYTVGQVGTGVEVSAITQSRATYLDGIYRSTQAAVGLYGTQVNDLSTVQSLFGEPGSSGLSSAMNQFFQSFQTLAQDPSNGSYQTTVQQDGETLTSQIQSVWANLQSVAQEATAQVGNDTGTVNTYLQEIAQLNGAIANAQTMGEQPNNLLDQQNLILDKLSKLIGITATTTTQPLGANTLTQVSVTVEGPGGTAVSLVDGQKYGSLALSGNPSSGLTLTATDTVGNTTALDPSSGTIGAGMGLVNTTLNPAVTGSLAYAFNQVVANLASTVNAQSAVGYYQDPTGTWQTGENFFTSSNGNPISAANIEVNPVIASDAGAIPAGATPNTGDGQNAQAIADIAQQPNGPTAQYASFISTVGSQVDLAQNLSNTSDALLTQITNQRQETGGVSINNEMTTIVAAQTVYQAAGSVAQAADQMLQTLINDL